MINIKNYKRTDEIKKLYELPRDSVVSLATEFKKDIPFIFLNVDGMYSCCQEIGEQDFIRETDGSPLYYHPAAWTEVYIWKRVPDVVYLVKDQK